MQMPHVQRFFFPVSDFTAGAHSAVAWTDARALTTLDMLARRYPAPFTVRSAFRRYPDIHRGSGLCFSLVSEKTDALRACCIESKLFASVSPPFFGGQAVTVTVDCPPSEGCGVHIFALQDALKYQGLFTGPLSGTLCLETRRALARLTNAGGNATIVAR